MEPIFINDFEINPDTNLGKMNMDWNYSNGFCFDDNGRVAIVYEKEKGYWCLPGGGKEAGETPVETFLREVREEAQAEVNMDTLKYFHCVYGKGESILGFRFICKLKNIEEFIPNKIVNNFVSEIVEIKFVTLEELPNYITWLKDTENGRDSFERLKDFVKYNGI